MLRILSSSPSAATSRSQELFQLLETVAPESFLLLSIIIWQCWVLPALDAGSFQHQQLLVLSAFSVTAQHALLKLEIKNRQNLSSGKGFIRTYTAA